MKLIPGRKTAFGLLTALFLVANIGGIFTVTMMDGGVTNCPYMGAPTLCAMGPLQHLSEWQQTFATVVQKTAAEILLLLVLCIALLLLIGLRVRAPSAVARLLLYDSPPSVPQSEKITRWLSLFELSPSFV